jgi:type II secretory pathway component PulF
MNGRIQADSPDAARQQLAAMDMDVRSITDAPPPRPSRRIAREEFLLFNQQLASVVEAGIPLERGLRDIATDLRSKRLRRHIEAIADSLEAGRSVEEAFDEHAAAFPPTYARVIRAGMTSGQLGEMLASLSRHVEISIQTRRLVIEAIAYPLMVCFLGAIVVTGVYALVMPQFKLLFEGSVALERTPQVVFTITDNIWLGWIIVGSLAAVAIVGRFVLRRSPGGRVALNRIDGGVPVIGRIWQAGVFARFADSLALLAAAKTDLPTALRLAADASGAEIVRQEADTVAACIEQGDSLTEAAETAPHLPRLLFYTMQVHADRGALPDGLYQMADMYTAHARADQGRLQALLGPICVLVVGVLLGLAVASMFVPMTYFLNTTF